MEETKQSLIASLPSAPRKPKSKVERVVRKTFKGTAHLSNLLPTGSVMSFQIMCPVLTHQGQCPTITSRWLTCFLVSLCAISCFLFSFTDSIRDPNGKVRYGLATWSGLLVMDGSITLTEEEKEKYKLKILDFIHAIMSMLVFFAVSMFDQNPVKASASETFCVTIRSLPSRVNTGWGFSSMMKTRSAGITPGCSLPFSGNVIFVPFFHPAPPPPAPSPNEAYISSPNMRLANLCPPVPPPPPPNGVENPKNSANISSALLGLNLKDEDPSPVEK
nr:hypothetical protein F20O9.170 - Arabidopsis thaliana [Arabidopsis thaliana]